MPKVSTTRKTRLLSHARSLFHKYNDLVFDNKLPEITIRFVAKYAH